MPDPRHGAEAEYWTPKLARNIERDLESTAALEAHGWLVLRFWSHEPVTEVVERIVETVRIVETKQIVETVRITGAVKPTGE